MITFTGERYVPGATGMPDVAYEHQHRYTLAETLVRGKTVLDLASGEGYGSALLSRSASSVVGVEIDPQSVHHAASKYLSPNLTFMVGSITKIPLAEQRFDVITCFEAFEHIAEQDQLLSEVKRLLAPGGLFLVSTPNKLVYTDMTGEKNPYHVREFYKDEFVQILKKYFATVQLYGQQVTSSSLLWSEQTTERDTTSRDFLVRAAQTDLVPADQSALRAKYFLAICSDAPLHNLPQHSSLSDIDDTRFAAELAAKKQIAADRDRMHISLQTIKKQADHHIAAGKKLQKWHAELTVALKKNQSELDTVTRERDRLAQLVRVMQTNAQTSWMQRLRTKLRSLFSAGR